MADEQRRRALKHGRVAVARYRAGKYRRVIGPANKAETALFALVHADSADAAAAFAFGEVAAIRSVTMTLLRGDLPAVVAQQAARAALWAFDQATTPPDDIPTEFTWADNDTGDTSSRGDLGVLPAGRRVAAAADARLALAERLIAHPRQEQAVDAMSATELRRPADEVLVWRYCLDSAVGMDTWAEARLLAREAVQLYGELATAADRFGLAGEERARDRAARIDKRAARGRRPA